MCWGLNKCPNGMLDDFKCKYGALMALAGIILSLVLCGGLGIKIEKKIKKIRE